jgi:hypothetical protein
MWLSRVASNCGFPVWRGPALPIPMLWRCMVALRCSCALERASLVTSVHTHSESDFRRAPCRAIVSAPSSCPTAAIDDKLCRPRRAIPVAAPRITTLFQRERHCTSGTKPPYFNNIIGTFCLHPLLQNISLVQALHRSAGIKPYSHDLKHLLFTQKLHQQQIWVPNLIPKLTREYAFSFFPDVLHVRTDKSHSNSKTRLNIPLPPTAKTRPAPLATLPKADILRSKAATSHHLRTAGTRHRRTKDTTAALLRSNSRAIILPNSSSPWRTRCRSNTIRVVLPMRQPVRGRDCARDCALRWRAVVAWTASSKLAG